MKKLCFAAFVAFWSSVGTLLALQAVATDRASPAAAFGAVSQQPIEPRNQ